MNQEQYKLLWDDIEIRKGEHYKEIIEKWCRSINKNVVVNEELLYTAYRFDQEVRSHLFRYIEVVDKTAHKIISENFPMQYIYIYM